MGTDCESVDEAERESLNAVSRSLEITKAEKNCEEHESDAEVLTVCCGGLGMSEPFPPIVLGLIEVVADIEVRAHRRQIPAS